ncbi:uncharacterized protein LOC118566100 [Fundulus heteroclitus]|uniref:uncharacterized protein LOC118566100 n=1 Tax=Fundulus heteroclitus TaxID=8078 RepID=UPI00165C3D71|nr:uncharacterized protein LOC118566100 [Fundulus heteroclitus]
MVDSGATSSVIRAEEFEIPPRLSGSHVFSLSASGQVTKEQFTKPLTCVTPEGSSFKHSFLLSSLCPVNLLGRDLMIELGIVLISTPEGVLVSTGDRTVVSAVKYSPQNLLYAYEWKFQNSLFSGQLMEEVKQLVNPLSETKSSTDLSCTAHTSRGPDADFEEAWFRVSSEKLTFSTLYWSSQYAALAINLLPQQLAFFRENGIPHIPLTKPVKGEWSELTNFVSQCQTICDWTVVPQHPNILFSQRLSAYKRPFTGTVHCQRTVHLVPENETFLSHGLFPEVDVTSHPLLSQVPSELWAKNKYDVGLIKGCEPVIVTPKSDYRPCQKQYPLKQEAVEGIRPVFESLLKEGVIIECPNSPVSSPLFPVKKVRDQGKPVEWRFILDLQRVNSAVIGRTPVLPNPTTILSQIPMDAAFFSVVDLSNAFFSVPVHKDSQYWFGFQFEGKLYTFTRLVQGYTESPTIFNAALKASLDSLQLRPGTTLVQYVDDILLCSPTKQQCEEDTVALLKHLHSEGHKASLSKLQFVQPQVTFLGHHISSEGRTLSPKRVAAVQNIPKPVTKKQLLSFLGITSYCRNFVPNYSVLEAPLSAIMHGKDLQPADKLTWTSEAESAFSQLKLALQQAPTLGLPDPKKPFVQAVDEKHGCMTSVLMQDHGGKLRPVAYYSGKLDPVAAGLPGCLRAVAAAERAVLASRDIVGYSELTVLVPHNVAIILLEQKTSHLSAARWLRYTSILLDLPNITVKRCNVLNPATLLPTPEDGDPHNCVSVLEEVCTPRPDLSDVPVENPDLQLFVDGSSYVEQGLHLAASPCLKPIQSPDTCPAACKTDMSGKILCMGTKLTHKLIFH